MPESVVVYLDDDIIVVNKPAGTAACSENASVEALLSGEFGQVYTVHRLDRETSGLMVFARTRAAAATLSAQLKSAGGEKPADAKEKSAVCKEKKKKSHPASLPQGEGKKDFVKEYAAVVLGDMTGSFCVDRLRSAQALPNSEARIEPEGSAIGFAAMDDLLFHDRTKNKSYIVKRSRAGVKRALLLYRPIAVKDGMTFVEVALKTGRTHQIRVQFSSRGFPIFADRKYGGLPEGLRGGDRVSQLYCSGKKIALLCRRLSFIHPKSGKRLFFSLSLPSEYPWSVFEE